MKDHAVSRNLAVVEAWDRQDPAHDFQHVLRMMGRLQVLSGGVTGLIPNASPRKRLTYSINHRIKRAVHGFLITAST